MVIILNRKEELVGEIVVIGTLGEGECVILEFVVMKEGSAVYGPHLLQGLEKHISKIRDVKGKYDPLVLT